MFLHVTNAKYLRDYSLWIEFNDGTSGNIDLKHEISGKIFQPLQDLDYFKTFKIQCHTVAWENGVDYAPEYLKKIMVERYKS